MAATPTPPAWSPPQQPPPRPPDRGGGGSGAGWIAALVGIGCLGIFGLVVVGGGAAWLLLARVPDPGYAVTPTPVAIGGPVPAAFGGPTVAGPSVFDPHASERMQVPIPAGSPSRGAIDARVTIVELGDFQCPFCARASATVARVLADYPSDVRHVWLDQPLDFHPAARMAARAGMEAQAQGGDARFWAMHDLLFANQSGLDRAPILALGAQAGLDPMRLAAAVDGTTYDAAILSDTAIGTRFDARGTPIFFVNGRRIMGAQPYDVFRAMVDEEIAHARSFEAAGVARPQLYDAITAHALTSPPVEPAAPAAAAHEDEDADRVLAVPVGTSPAIGRSDALVTIVEFSDFQCPFCSRVAPTLARLRETYGADLRIVYKHNPLPFHERAMPAAVASMAVMDELGPEAFFRMHDLLFENQRALEEADLIGYARQVGASESRVRAALARGSHASIVADQALATQLGATGTPQFFVNGRSLRGAQPYEAFATLVDAELARARAMVAAGTPRDRVYDVIMAGAQ